MLLTFTLPKEEGDLYRFAELPDLLADAKLGERPEDRPVWVLTWKDDGTKHGAFVKYWPPADIGPMGFEQLERCGEWRAEPITVPDSADGGSSDELHRLYYELNRDKAKTGRGHAYWPLDGSLIVDVEYTQLSLAYSLIVRPAEVKWVRGELMHAATLPVGDPARLKVQDWGSNVLRAPTEDELEAGWVTLDGLNAWGLTLEPPRRFVTGVDSATAPRPKAAAAEDVSEIDHAGEVSDDGQADWIKQAQAIAQAKRAALKGKAYLSLIKLAEQIADEWNQQGSLSPMGVPWKGANIKRHALNGLPKPAPDLTPRGQGK